MNSTAEELKSSNEYEHNELNYNLFKETFQNFKFTLNKSLYDTLSRYKKEYEQEYGTTYFYYDIYIDKRLCIQLKRLLIGYNYKLTRFCKKNTFIFYYILTHEQRNELFDIMINDNHFVLYSLIQIKTRNQENLHKEYDLMQKAFYELVNNMKQVFRIDFSFKEKYKDLTIYDI